MSQFHYAHRTKRMESSIIREILKVVGQPGMISLAGGLPAPEAFPVELIRTLSDQVISTWKDSAFQYAASEGFAPLREALGEERPAAICRELTKKFEEVLRGSLGDLAERIAGRELKGEVVVLVDRGTDAVTDETMEAALVRAMAQMTLKDAAATVAEAYGIPRRKVYQAALEMEKAR